MLAKKSNKIFFFLLVGAIFLSLIPEASANILDSWRDKNAYKPNPVLFLHGFAIGAPGSWSKIVDGDASFDGLNKFFAQYTPVSSNRDLSRPYLERIAFNDPNGSVDTYTNGKKGWADKLKDRITQLLWLYKFKNTSLKFNLICHSMGGLAAREYLTNPKYGSSFLNVNKLITIGTPHCGTPLANLKEVVVCDINKIIWEIPGVDHLDFYVKLETNDTLVQYLKGVYRLDPNGEAEKDMAIKSQFLKTLNGRIQNSNIKNYAIFGQVDSAVNWLFFRLYYEDNALNAGDEIVPVDSQKGYDMFTDYPDSFKYRWVWDVERAESIPWGHLEELNHKESVQKILSFLDSEPPELEITSPALSGTTEIQDTSIHIQGRVYKEYFPADTQLTINVTRQEDGYSLVPQTSLLKPSNLWIPNNPDSPVAEFDETINFPGNGTYKITCKAKNPAGVPSQIKEVWVKVTSQTGTTNIIVHCHNPEGKEIASIQGRGLYDVTIYDGDTLISHGAYNAESHNKPMVISAGAHVIKAKFNGMTKEQTIALNPDETKILTFIFERVSRQDEIRAALDAQGSETFEVWGYDRWNTYNTGWHKFTWVGANISDYNPGRWRATVNTTLSSSRFHMEINFTEFEGRAFDCSVMLTTWNYGCEVTNLIPAHTDFNQWFIQGFWGGPDKTQLSGIIIKEHKTDWQNVFNITPPYSLAPQYFIKTIPADKTYNSISGGPLSWPWSHAIFGLEIAIAARQYGGIPFYEYHPMTLDLIFDNLKFSSVPYDLTGTGI